ncbi:DUF3499 domain-containing protein [Ornithinimicrobium sp. Arc0846-15]|nr:DUF3499 domain-containing protein [Ornithinimicrobium laminariae]
MPLPRRSRWCPCIDQTLRCGVVGRRCGPRDLEWGIVTISRQCSRTACGHPAVATLTYVYAEQTAVLGPLATYAEPHSYDLCTIHAGRLTAPRGWDIVRIEAPEGAAPPADDLVALAEAVRERRDRPAAVQESEPMPPTDGPRRGHLRILRDN